MTNQVAEPEYMFFWNAFPSDDGEEIVADRRLLKLLSQTGSETEWKVVVQDLRKHEVKYCHPPYCDGMFLLNHGVHADSLQG